MTREEFVARYQQLRNPTYIDLPDEVREKALELMAERAVEYGLPEDFAERIIIEGGPPLTLRDAEVEADFAANKLDIEAMMPSPDAAQRGYEETPKPKAPEQRSETAREDHMNIIQQINDAGDLYAGVFNMRTKPTPGARNPLETIYLQEQRLDDRGPVASQRGGPARGYLQSEEGNTAEVILQLIKAARKNQDYVQEAIDITEDEDTLASLRELHRIVKDGNDWFNDFRSMHSGAAPGGREYLEEQLENVQRIQDIKELGDPAFDAFLHLAMINANPKFKKAFDEMRRTSASNTPVLLENLNVIQRAGSPISEEKLRKLIQESERR